jgi:diacylglycerol kinase family enzyme
LGALFEFAGGASAEEYRLTVTNRVNGQDVVYRRILRTLLMYIDNGRYSGGKMPITPAAIFNDGLMDLAFVDSNILFSDLPKMLDGIILNCGTHAYDEQKMWKFVRGQTVKIENLNYEFGASDLPDPEKRLKEQYFHVDGEGLKFREFIRMDVIPESIEVILDFEHLMAQSSLLKARDHHK